MSRTQEKKLELLEWMASIKDEKLIEELVKWKRTYAQTNEERYNRELEEADAEIDSGEFLTHDEALKEIKSWREQ